MAVESGCETTRRGRPDLDYVGNGQLVRPPRRKLQDYKSICHRSDFSENELRWDFADSLQYNWPLVLFHGFEFMAAMMHKQKTKKPQIPSCHSLRRGNCPERGGEGRRHDCVKRDKVELSQLNRPDVSGHKRFSIK